MRRRKLLSFAMLALFLLGGVISISALTKSDSETTGPVLLLEVGSYATLQDAIDAAPADGKGSIRMLGGINDFGTVNIKDKQIQIDINGQELKGAGINVDGAKASLTVVDGYYNRPEVAADYTITNGNKGSIKLTRSIDARNGATVEWNNGVIETTSTDEKCAAIRAYGDLTGQTSIPSTIHVYGGYVKGVEGCVGVFGQGATAVIGQQASPILEATDNAPVAGNGSNEDGNKRGGTSITIGKSTIIGKITTKGYVACGVYHPQSGTLTIEDGANIVAVGGAGIVMRGGKLDIKGGTITATGDKDLTGYVGDKKNAIPTSGIVYDHAAGYPDNANVNILVTGGTITGAHSAVELIAGSGEKGTITLTGGTYSSDVSNFLAAEYHITKDATGKYTPTLYEAKVTKSDGTVYYASLADALASKVSKITLLTDATLSDKVSTYNGANSMELDLNGHDIKMSGRDSYIGCCSVGTLTLCDSKGTGRIYNDPECTNRFIQYLFSIGGENSGSSFTIQSGTIDATNLDYVFNVINTKDLTGHINITGGTVKNFAKGVEGQSMPIFNLNGGDDSHVEITGGTFSEQVSYFNKEEYILEKSQTKYLFTVSKIAMVITYENSSTTSSIGSIGGVFPISYTDEKGNPMAKMEVRNNIPDVTLTLMRSFAKDKWEALYLPYAIKVTDKLLANFDVAEIWDTELKEKDETTAIEFIKLKAGQEIPAYTPCLVKRKSDTSSFEVEGTDVTTTVPSEPINCSTVKQLFTFYGVLGITSFADMDFTSKSYYVLDAENQTLVQVDGTNSLSALKFYMTIENRNTTQASAPQASRVAMRVIGDGGEVTEITELVTPTAKADGRVYNLQGICVGTTTEGLPAGVYIQNGRKIIVK